MSGSRLRNQGTHPVDFRLGILEVRTETEMGAPGAIMPQ